MKRPAPELPRRVLWTWVKLWTGLWRRYPIAGGGRVVRALALGPAARAGETVVELDRVSLHVRVSNPPEEAVLLWRRYEEDVVAAIRTHLREGMVAIDVGANCGVLSVMMGAAVGAAGRVISIDPSAPACARTVQQAEINAFRNIETVEAALTDEPGAHPYRRGKFGIGVLPAVDEAYVTGPTVPVAEMTLDELTTTHGLQRLDFIKLDTDGSELSVLRGGAETLRAHRPVISAEVNPEGLRARGHSPAELLTHLRELGYDLFDPAFRRRSRLSRAPHAFDRFVPLTGAAAGAEVHNILAVPSERSASMTD